MPLKQLSSMSVKKKNPGLNTVLASIQNNAVY